jgi:Cys-tRNA(Pro)/Cys-tRNA(Cys) deacylase
MRILDRQKIPYEVNLYTCDNFVDGMQIADMLGQSYESTFKTLVTVGKSGGHYVFCIPVHLELDLKKAAKAVGEKNLEMVHVKDILPLTGYIRGGCTPLGMKKAFPTVIHSSVLTLPQVILSGGRIGAQILIKPDDLLRATGAKTADVVKEAEE